MSTTCRRRVIARLVILMWMEEGVSERGLIWAWFASSREATKGASVAPRAPTTQSVRTTPASCSPSSSLAPASSFPTSSPMPSEHLSPLPVANQLPAAQQTKLCSSCHCLLPTADTDSSLLSAHHDLHGVIDANDHSIICRLCRDKSTSRTPRAALQALFVDVNDDCLRRGSNRATELPHPVHIERRPTRSDSLYSPLSATPSSSSTLFSHSSALFSPDVPDVESPASSVFTPIKPSRPFIYSALPPISSEISPLPASTRFTSSPTKSPLSEYETASAPDPFMDITRLRVRSQPHHCLYPGATFQGTQKSGRHSYDVKVSIVVCLPDSVHPAYQRSALTIGLIGRRFRILFPLWLSLHTGTHRRLARTHHIL